MAASSACRCSCAARRSTASPLACVGPSAGNVVVGASRVPGNRRLGCTSCRANACLCALALGEDEELPLELMFEIEGQAIPTDSRQFPVEGTAGSHSGSRYADECFNAGVQCAASRLAVRRTAYLVAGTDSMPVAAARLQDGAAWSVDASLPLTADWHGACAVARADGALIGLVVWRDGAAFIAPWRP